MKLIKYQSIYQIGPMVLAHLFVKVPWPGDSEETSLVSSQTATRTQQANCPVYLQIILLMLNVKEGRCEYQLFKSFGLTWPGNEIQIYRLHGRYFNH